MAWQIRPCSSDPGRIWDGPTSEPDPGAHTCWSTLRVGAGIERLAGLIALLAQTNLPPSILRIQSAQKCPQTRDRSCLSSQSRQVVSRPWLHGRDATGYVCAYVVCFSSPHFTPLTKAGVYRAAAASRSTPQEPMAAEQRGKLLGPGGPLLLGPGRSFARPLLTHIPSCTHHQPVIN